MNTFARAISIVAHPFVTVSLMAGLSAAHFGGRRDAALVVAAVTVLVVAPVAALMHRQVTQQRWENADASNVSERPLLFVVSSLGLIALVGYALFTHSGSFFIRGSAGTLAMMAACAFMTPWIKVSLHLAFASLAATTLVLVGSPAGWAVVAVIPVLAWSRLRLSRHRPGELALGIVVGAAAALLVCM